MLFKFTNETSEKMLAPPTLEMLFTRMAEFIQNSSRRGTLIDAFKTTSALTETL